MYVESRSSGDGPGGDGGRPSRSRSLAELLVALEDVVGEITALDPAELDGAAAVEAAARVHRANDRLRAQEVSWLGTVESTGAWRGAGARSFRAWLGRVLEVPYTEASAIERCAKAWHGTLAATGAAARAGQIPTAKAALIVSAANTPARVAALSELWPEDEGAATNRGGPDGSGAGAATCETFEAPTGERVLLDLAQGYGVADFARITRRFAHVVDPEADERGYREALDREFFDLAATTGGYHLSGFLTRDHGQVLKTAMRAVTGVPDRQDSRTANQRRAGALVDLSRLVLDKGLTGKVGTVRPHLSVHVSFTELEHVWRRSSVGATGDAATTCPSSVDATGEAATTCCPEGAGSAHGDRDARRDGGAKSRAASPSESRERRDGLSRSGLARLVTAPPAEWEDRTGPVPEAVLRRIAADCDLTRVVFGPDSQVIDVGRTRRTFAGHLRRAVVARDRACVIDGCGAPASMSEVHHARLRWADGGDTKVSDAALVCRFHNRWLEEARVPMRWVVDAASGGRWQVGRPGSYRPDGSGDFPGDSSHDLSRDGPLEGPAHVPRTDTS